MGGINKLKREINQADFDTIALFWGYIALLNLKERGKYYGR